MNNFIKKNAKWMVWLVIVAALLGAQIARGDVTLWYLDGTVLRPVDSSWTAEISSGPATPGGADTNVQFNDGGSLAGLGSMIFNKTTRLFTTENINATSTLKTANAGLQLADTNASHYLTISPGSDLTAARTLTITTGDAARTITLSGNPTLADWFDQSVKQAASPTFAGLTVGSGSGLALTTSGAFSTYAGTSCTNQFVRSLNASGAATCASVSLTADITGALGIANGGLGAAFTDPNADQLMFWDDSESKITGIGTLSGLAISGTTLTVNDVTCTDCLNATEIEDLYILNNGDVGTGDFDFGGAGAFEIPNGTGPTVDAAGEIAVDTTSDQLVYYGGAKRVALKDFEKSITLASSTLAYMGSFGAAGTTTLKVYNPNHAITINRMYCLTDTGTAFTRFGDGTNWADTLQATSGGAEDSSMSNNAFTADESFQVQVGTSASSPNYVTCTYTGTEDAD